MKSIFTTYLIVFSIVAGSFLSCKKKAPYAEAGVTEVSITFQSPTENGTFQVGSEVNIEGIIDANAMMSGWRIEIGRESGELIDSYEDHYDQTQYIFHHHWFPASQDTGKIYVKTIALDQQLQPLDSSSTNITCY